MVHSHVFLWGKMYHIGHLVVDIAWRHCGVSMTTMTACFRHARTLVTSPLNIVSCSTIYPADLFFVSSLWIILFYIDYSIVGRLMHLIFVFLGNEIIDRHLTNFIIFIKKMYAYCEDIKMEVFFSIPSR